MSEKSVTEISDDEQGEESTMPNQKKDKEDIEALAQAPDWLPDGWVMEVYRQEDGIINRYYTSPVSDHTFTTEKEVLDYLFSGEDEDILKLREESVADNTLQKAHQWLPKGWVMEIRAGGEKMDKMYKFYVHSETGVRLVSKEDVLLYLCDAEISECDTKGQCDTSSEDNILAKVELNPSELPDGWVKEEVFRKTKKRVRGDLNYTDPTTGYTFPSLKAALRYLKTQKIPKSAIIQETSVHDLYSFDKSADLPERLRKRLAAMAKHDQKLMTSSQPREISKIEQYHSANGFEDDDTMSSKKKKGKAAKKTRGEEATCSEAMKHPSGRPPKFCCKEASLKEK